MLLELSSDQALILHSLDRIATRYAELPIDHGECVQYSRELQHELEEGGFLAIAHQEGFGNLDAALVAERTARMACSVEASASALVAPALGRELNGPLALCEGIGRPTRYLAQARHVCLLTAGGVALADVSNEDVREIDSVVAYPLGELVHEPANAVTLDDEASARVLTLWRIALAAEAAGLMRAALDLTVGYVSERQQFGRPLGDLQAIQHRLAADEQIVAGAFVLAMRAADTLAPVHAATAALYAQHHMRTIVYDCHQFHGAMGLTLEYPLHLWTYRLKFLQGELGGRSAQARALADLLWPNSASASNPQYRAWRNAFGRSWFGV